MTSEPVNHSVTLFNVDRTSSLNLYDNLFGLWLPAVLVLFGIVGNALSLWVLYRDNDEMPEQRCTTFTSLKALAVSDLILLIGALLQQIIPIWCLNGAPAYLVQFCLLQGYPKVYAWPIVCIAQMASIWLTVLISAERFLAICAPFRAPRVGGLRRIKIAIFFIFVASITFNIPRFFEFITVTSYEIILIGKTPEGDEIRGNFTKVELEDSSLRHDRTYRYLYNTALYCLVMFALPFLALAYLNGRLVQALRAAKKNWCGLNRTQKKEMKATKLPLVIVFVFFISSTQSFIGFVLDAIFVSDDSVQVIAWLETYTAFANLLVIFNAAINFLLLLCFGRKFRSMLADALRCRRSRRIRRQGSGRWGRGSESALVRDGRRDTSYSLRESYL